MAQLKKFFIFLLLVGMTMTANQTQAKLLKTHLYKEKLDNGLTVLVKETPGTKVATVQIWVKAGSIYEGPNEGGITHFIEHMIFKGTETLGAGEVAGAIEEKGGQINAYTSFEHTVYHATLSARYWARALEVLADAVLNSVFDAKELEREKKVVLEEIGMRNDRPNIKLFQELMSTSYTTHPYRLPVIGTVESVSSFSRDDIVRYIDEHYHPANFTIVVVGDVSPSSVFDKARELFGGLAARVNGESELPQEPEQKEARLFHLEEDVNESQLALSFPITSFKDPDTPVLDVISDILGHGETSRLYHQLRSKKGLVYRINSSAMTQKYPGLFEVFATLDSAQIRIALEEALTEIFKLKYVPVEESELTRMKHGLESEFIFNLERVEGQARVLGAFYMQTGDPREDDYLDRVRSVTRDDILRVAGKYFNGTSITVGYLAPHGNEVGLSREDLIVIIDRAEKTARESIPTSLVTNAYMSDLHSFRLKNGVRLLVREEQEVPTVAIRAVFPGGLRGETLQNNGAFAFIADLLTKGTKKMSARDISLQIADMAGEVRGFNGKNTFGLKANFLSRFFEDGLELVRDILLTPAFSPEEAEKIRPERLSALRQQEDSLPSLAFKEFNRLLFQSHPYGLNTMGSQEALVNITADDLHDLYRQYARPEKLVLAVSGKVKAGEVYKAVEKLFSGWQAGESAVAEEEFLPPEAPAEPQLYRINRDKAQVHIIIGFLGTTMKSPDRYAIEIIETVLSGQSGRLFSQLRDTQSLAYSLSSFSLIGLDTGSLGVYIGTSPDKKEEAIASVWRELYKLREQPITKEELERAQNTLVGHYELNLQTHGSQAMEIALNQTYGLGQDFGKKYVHEISQVTPQKVMEVARKYIRPENYVLVTVGAE